MLNQVIRFGKRAVVLLPIVIVGYLSVFKIYPIFEDHVPWVVALVVTYAVGAYLLVPGIMRLVRIIRPPKHVPLYCITADGFASDPLNIGLIGTREQVVQAMKKAGWLPADKLTIRTGARTLLSTLYGWRYDTPPMSLLFLFGRRQDLAFQLPIEDGRAGARHHVRFWAATYTEKDKLSARAIHWHNRQAHVRDDKLLWLGAASRDIGVTFIRHSAQLTHLVDPNTDAERELITKQLQAAKAAKLKDRIKLGEPYKLVNIHALRGDLHTDGRMAILEIHEAGNTRKSAKSR